MATAIYTVWAKGTRKRGMRATDVIFGGDCGDQANKAMARLIKDEFGGGRVTVKVVDNDRAERIRAEYEARDISFHDYRQTANEKAEDVVNGLGYYLRRMGVCKALRATIKDTRPTWEQYKAAAARLGVNPTTARRQWGEVAKQ